MKTISTMGKFTTFTTAVVLISGDAFAQSVRVESLTERFLTMAAVLLAVGVFLFIGRELVGATRITFSDWQVRRQANRTASAREAASQELLARARIRLDSLETLAFRPELAVVQKKLEHLGSKWAEKFLDIVAEHPSESEDRIVKRLEGHFREGVPFGNPEIEAGYASLNDYPPEIRSDFRKMLFKLGQSADPQNVAAIIAERWLTKRAEEIEGEQAHAAKMRAIRAAREGAIERIRDARTLFDALESGTYTVNLLKLRKLEGGKVVVFDYPGQINDDYKTFGSFEPFWLTFGYAIAYEWMAGDITPVG